MRELKTWRFVAASIAGMAALSVVVLARPSASAAPLPPMPSADDLKQFGIVQVVDVFYDPTVGPPALPAARAVDIAAKHLGKTSTSVRILHGSAKPTEDQPPRSVWVILFTGGNMPVLGPPGASRPSVPIRFTGVELDEQTGEVLTWFMH